ncbi:[Fe-Fe] hydrogenase large subunit C-terminal domain-containing protein [Anaerovorax odorimutans]|uniref:[Fe-Fe] hydrogenase large subunit C-terminal domain-containing protein n=1 Tax=Anaerovorax odorimutans TaxID=109327 RepID=UPI0004109AA9|nr:[Fe-Fe] hydrogenase large subunit C-terminal domain-containing protein [Anaerovorax odorimutans]
MGIIQFKKANCKHCYKCVRKCYVKAIALKDEQAQIIERECILCGQCFLVCPQNAKYIKTDIYKIKNYIKRGEKVYVSLAPSFASAFDGISFRVMSSALKRLGFMGVEETAIGAGMVTAEYEKILKSGKMRNMITTCCPTVNLLIENYFPDLLQYAAPVVSPAIAHGQVLKKVYGKDIKVVFVGPCISKKYEAEKSISINATLMFDELLNWLEEENISLNKLDENPTEMHGIVNRLYPIPGGILKTVSNDSKKTYKSIAVDGLDRCIQMLEALREDLYARKEIKGYFIEMSACPGSCSYGPALKDYDKPLLLARENIIENARKCTHTKIPKTETEKVDLFYEYENLQAPEDLPSEDELNAILESMGKTSEKNIYNCGACGYDTCREKAIAVWQGKAEIKMCVPFMWEKMESFSNLVMDNAPNAVIVVDKKFDIVEYNKAAVSMFNLYKFSHEGLPLEMVFDCTHIQIEARLGNNVYDEIQFVEDVKKTVEITSIKADIGENYVIFVKDITEDMVQKEKIVKMREETLDTAQKVIDNQMRVAQEIASLLGETTGETKVALTDLKKSILKSEEIEESVINSKRW